MPETPRSFRDLLNEAITHQKTGRLQASINCASYAFQAATEHSELAEALQVRGVTKRLARDYEGAIDDFNRALILARSDEHTVARIWRDLGMVFLDLFIETGDENRRKTALEYFAKSREALFKLNDIPEWAISVGFVARACWYGEQRDKNIAVSLYHQADDALRKGDNRDYELNNLVWMMRVIYLPGKLRHFPRAVRLIVQTKQWRRIPGYQRWQQLTARFRK